MSADPVAPSAQVQDTIARTLAAADILSVAADDCEERGTEMAMKRAAKLAGHFYFEAGVQLEFAGRLVNAAEAFGQAERHFVRAGAESRELANDCQRRKLRCKGLLMDHGMNIYDP